MPATAAVHRIGLLNQSIFHIIKHLTSVRQTRLTVPCDVDFGVRTYLIYLYEKIFIKHIKASDASDATVATLR